MQVIHIIFQLAFIFEILIFISGLFLSKSDKRDRHLIAAKYDREMPERVREVLEEVGDHPVVKIQLGRTPVKAVLLLLLNLFSAWKFNQKQIELGYDEIYHNYLLITIRMNNKSNNLKPTNTVAEDDTMIRFVYKLEKAHRIRLLKPQYPEDFVNIYDIPLTPNKMFTLNRLISIASNVDKYFYTYDAGKNNMCQTFVENIVDINGLTPNIVDENTRTALKPQDAKSLVATLGSRSDIVRLVTDFSGIIDKLVTERKISWKPPVDKVFTLFGDMHVILEDENANTEELLQNSDGAVTINGSKHITLTNEDAVFNAIVSLEDEDKSAQRNQKIINIVCVVLGIILLVVAAVLIAFFLWKRRKDKLRLNELNNDKDSVSVLSEVSARSNTEQLD